MSLSLEQFAKNVSVSGLMSADEIKAFHASLPKEKRKDAPQFATELVKQGKLTRYQAATLYQGTTANLVMGDYRVLDKIGAGGMGQVFKAEHRRMKRVVALKLLPPNVTKDAQAVKRFQREVETAARLVHSNIVTAYDAGDHKGVHYLIMEFVDGQDLSNLVKQQGTLPLETAVNFISQAARGLEHAHAEGVIHRDIKPANLLVDKKGTVKILDMGLARIDTALSSQEDAEAAEGLTSSGVMMGTVDYMSPEQAIDTRAADHRADIYSLGCTLFYLLVGRRMYEGDTLLKRILGHRDKPIPALAEQRPDVPAALVQVFERMVAKHPEERYPSMAAARQALDACLAKLDSGGESSVFHMEKVADDDLASFLRGMRTQSGTALGAATRVVTETVAGGTDSETRADSKSHSKSSSKVTLAPKSQRWMLAIGGGVGGAALICLLAFMLFKRPAPATIPPLDPTAQTNTAEKQPGPDAAAPGAAPRGPALPVANKFDLPVMPEQPATTPEPEKPPEAAPVATPPVQPAPQPAPVGPKTILVGIAAGEVPDLATALNQAAAGDTILIRHRGPLLMPPVDLSSKSPLTIIGDAVGGVDFWPLIVQAPPPSVPDPANPSTPLPPPESPALVHGNRVELTLKKLHLAAGGPAAAVAKCSAVFALARGYIRLETCSVTVGSETGPAETVGAKLPLLQLTSGPEDQVELSLRNCFVRGSRLGSCLAAAGAGQIKLDAEQLLWAGSPSAWIAMHDPRGPLQISLKQSTLYNVASLLNWESAVALEAKPAVQATALHSLFVGPYVNREPLITWKHAGNPSDFAAAAADGVAVWSGEGNVFHRIDGFYREPRVKSLASLTKWRALWAQAGATIDRESDPHFRVWPTEYLLQEANTWDFEPRFWRNKEKSRQIADEIGPAIAALPVGLPRCFDRAWPTPEQALSPRGVPRVLIVHQRDGPYRTIEAAMAEVRDGDIIEITDNGPYTPKRNFNLQPGDGVLVSPVDSLTLRAGRNASPLVFLRDDAQEGPSLGQQFFNGWLVLLGAYQRTSLQVDGLHFRVPSSPAQIQRTTMGVQTVGLTRASNCSFSVPLPTPAQFIYGPASNSVVWLENNAYFNTAKNEYELVRLDTGPTPEPASILCSIHNCLFKGNALAHRGNPGRRLKVGLSLHNNTFFLGRVAEINQLTTLSARATENLVFSPEAIFKFDDDSVWRTAAKTGDRNALWIGNRPLTEQERSEFSNSLLPGPALKAPPTFEGAANARDPLRPYRIKRCSVTAADGSSVGVRFEYLPEAPPEG